MFLEWMAKWEPLWLFLFFAISASAELFTAYMSKKEFEYDEAKDIEKKQKRTRTTKKTTTQPSGMSVVEESTEVTEPTGDHSEKTAG